MKLGQRGFSVMEMVGFLGFVGVVTYAVISLTNISKRSSISSRVSFSGELLRKKVLALTQDEAAWHATVQTNPNLACLRTPVNCAGSGPGKGGTFALRNADGTLFYDPVPPTNGFSLEGEPCLTFNSAIGDNACPLRLTFSWQPICPTTGPCDHPKVRIWGGIDFMPSVSGAYKGMPFKKAKYAFDFRRGTVEGLGEGEAERLVKWKTPSEVTESAVTETGGKIGVSVPNPLSDLAVAGNAKVGAYAGDGVAATAGLLVSGLLGVGTPEPKAKVHVVGAVRVAQQVDCNAAVAGSIRYNGEKFEGCFPNGQWCPLTGCPPPPGP